MSRCSAGDASAAVERFPEAGIGYATSDGSHRGRPVATTKTGEPKGLPGEYNYEHFRARHFLADVKRALDGYGVQPGTLAPDFELQDTEGQVVRLTAFRGTPVLLHFGSYT